MTVWPSRRSASARAGKRAGIDAESASSARLPSATRLPSTVPLTPLPVTDSKSPGAASASPRSCGARRRSPRPADARCRVPGWRPAAAARPRSRARARRPRPARLALGQRAGLVDDQRVDLLQQFQRLGVRNSTPAVAPRPVPTMIDIGVARPSAQGQAMISTATALTSA